MGGAWPQGSCAEALDVHQGRQVAGATRAAQCPGVLDRRGDASSQTTLPPPYRTTDLEIGTTSWVCAPHVDTDAGVDSFDRWCIQVMLPEVHHGPIALSMRFGWGC